MKIEVKNLITEKTLPVTFNIIEQINTDLAYQAKVLGISKTKLLNDMLRHTVSDLMKQKEFIKMEEKFQKKNVKKYEKAQQQ